MKACIGPSGKLLLIWQTKKLCIANVPYTFDYWADPVVHLLKTLAQNNCAILIFKQFLLLGCPHSSVDLFAPSILLPQVRIPSILSTLLSIDIRIVTCTTDEKNQKEAGICIGPFLTIPAALVQIVSCRMLLIIIKIMIMIIGWWLMHRLEFSSRVVIVGIIKLKLVWFSVTRLRIFTLFGPLE